MWSIRVIKSVTIDRIFKPKYIFLCFWLYSILTALFVQFYLPVVMPHMFGDNGLLLAGDWNFFHIAASKLALSMDYGGFGVWVDAPTKQWPILITALHYWITGISIPYVLIPMHSFLRGLAAFIFLKIN